MIQIRNFNLWTRNVSILRFLGHLEITSLHTSQKNSSFKIKSLHFRSHFIHFIIWNFHIHLVCLKWWSFETILFIQPKKISDRTLFIPQEWYMSTDSPHIYLDCKPTKFSHPHTHFSKVFDNPLKDKALKTFVLLFHRTILIVSDFFRLRSQHFSFQRTNMAALLRKNHKLLLMLKLPFQKFMKLSTLKLSLSKIINQRNFKKCFTSSIKMNN